MIQNSLAVASAVHVQYFQEVEQWQRTMHPS